MSTCDLRLRVPFAPQQPVVTASSASGQKWHEQIQFESLRCLLWRERAVQCKRERVAAGWLTDTLRLTPFSLGGAPAKHTQKMQFLNHKKL